MIRPGDESSKASASQPPLARLHVWQIQAVRDVLVVAAALGLIWAGYAMRSVTVPLLVALLLAYLFEPLIAAVIKRTNASRPMVVGGLLLSIGVGLLVLLALLVPLVIGQTINLVNDMRAGRFENTVLKLKEVIPPAFQDDFEKALKWVMPESTPSSESNVPKAQDPELENRNPELPDESRIRRIIREEIAAQNSAQSAQAGPGWWNVAQTTGRTVVNVLGAIVQLGLLAFLIPFYFFFFSVWYPDVTRFSRGMIPVANRPRVLELIGKMDRAVAGFVRGRIVICLIMGVMLAVGWLIVGVPYPIVLGMLVGAFCLVPYLGGVGVPLAVGLLAIEELQLPQEQRMVWWAIILWPSLVYAIVQIVESYILTPMIAGKATNLDPVTILVAVLAGGSVGGVYGMILAIPVAACLKILITEVLLPKVRAWTRGEADDPLPISHA